mmetsp:Transcript_35987/g.78743  ORF Transcript_35987/g.78743 Transcript_35987/m.78743 type:complete len:139 (+) Transcript_35987:156-572(+)
MNSAAIEITGIAEQSSRLSLKKAMETFGEVVGCHIGNRGVDLPVVRFKTEANAEAALQALRTGQVWLDGLVLGGQWKGATRQQPQVSVPRSDDDSTLLTSRDLMERRGREKKSRSRDRGRNRRRRSRSRSRPRRRERE